MSTKQDELKAINAQKKELADKQKALREELNATKAERLEARKVQAEARKTVRDSKAELRDLTAKIKSTFKDGDSETVNKLADEIMEVASELAGTIRKFGESASSLENL